MVTATPSIVFITTDTMGRDMCSAYVDRPGVQTPHLERLARSGVLFENAFCTAPVCTPARASWYTGLPPNRTGAWTNNQSTLREVRMLAEILTESGYAARHYGKWHLEGGGYDGAGEPGGGFQEEWYDLARFHAEVGDDGLEPRRFGNWNRGHDDIEYCFAHRVAGRAIRAMRNHDYTGRPLLLAVEFDEPHGPYICPPPFRDHFSHADIHRPPTLHDSLEGKPRIQQEYSAFLRTSRPDSDDLPRYYQYYYNCNSYVDHEIGRVVDAVREHMPPDTVILYTSDHGDHLGSFGLCAKGPTMYDLTCAVPLIIDAPGITRPGGREAGLVSGVDLFATMLDLAGVAPPTPATDPDYHGRSLLPTLHGEAADERGAVFMEYNRFGMPQDQDEGFFPIRCIRTDRWKLSINLFDTDELYDLQEDPLERHNRIDDASLASIRNGLHDRLLDWQRQTKDVFRGPQWLKRPWREDAAHAFEGLFSTGYKQATPERPFA